MHRFLSVLAVLSFLPSCSLIASDALSLDYSFDALDFQEKLETTAGTVPSIPCGGQLGDTCGTLATMINDPSVSAFCDSSTNTCAATVEVRLSYTINLAQQSKFPAEAIKFGVRAATLSKVTYWIRQNTLSFATPPFEIFVAPETAVDERDQRAQKLGAMASLPSKSVACADMIDPAGDSAAAGAQVCRLPLDNAGRSALQTFAADYQTPFKLLVHGTGTLKAGDPIPTGTIGFSVRPTVALAISTSL